MRSRKEKIYAIFMLAAFVAAEVALLITAWRDVARLVGTVVGLVMALILAPTCHELGHFTFAIANRLKLKYIKCFCIRVMHRGGKYRFSFASPFAPDETQVLPMGGDNMKKRALAYAAGGLVFSGLLFLLLAIAAILVGVLKEPSFYLFGLLPYTGYLFLLNLPPVEYPSGKTDALVYQGIQKAAPAELTMLSAMQIQGRLSVGERYREIPKALFFDLPQLPEDEPTYAMLLFLRYRYFLDIEDMHSAADCLNRLAASAEYLSATEEEELAVELVYMHSLNQNQTAADECAALCAQYLQSAQLSAKRALAAYSFAFGEREKGEILLRQGRALLEKEDVLGVRAQEAELFDKLEKSLEK